MLEARFRLSEADFSRAHRAYLRSAVFSVKNLFLVTVALLIGAVQAQLFGGADWALKVFGGIWLAVIALVVFVYVRMPARVYRMRPELSGEQVIRLDEDGVHSGAKILLWKDVARVSESDGFLLIHVRGSLPWIISGGARSREIREFVEGHL